jgi:hypothetical protein
MTSIKEIADIWESPKANVFQEAVVGSLLLAQVFHGATLELMVMMMKPVLFLMHLKQIVVIWE